MSWARLHPIGLAFAASGELALAVLIVRVRRTARVRRQEAGEVPTRRRQGQHLCAGSGVPIGKEWADEVGLERFD